MQAGLALLCTHARSKKIDTLAPQWLGILIFMLQATL